MADRPTADEMEVPGGPAGSGADAAAVIEGWHSLGEQWRSHPEGLFALQQQLQARMAAIWLGEQTSAPSSDTRFADPDWHTHPVFRRIRQSYEAWCEALDQWLEQSGLQGLERRRADFLLEAAKDIYAPVNSPFTPETVRRAVETDGQSLVTGMQNYLADLRDNHGYPAIADRSAFRVGQDVAASEGAVVFRNDMFELIQYRPLTRKVRKTPLLYVFSQVNRFYLGDLTPQRSLFRQLLEAGIQVFAVSWRNPLAEHAHWDLASYAQSVVQAISVIRDIAECRKVDLMGLCAGGATAAAAAGLMAARGQRWVKSLSLFVTILDNRPGENDFNLFATDDSVALQKARVRAQGYANERDVLEMFAMLRLDESVFSFVRSNYFRGEAPLAHPLLFWSMDYTRVPAEMQCDLIDLGHHNALARGDLMLAGAPIVLSDIEYPVYIMAGLTDHITPWPACYRSAHLFGGEVTFVLTNQNHTQTISAAPANPHLKYWLNDTLSVHSEDWRSGAVAHAGDWRTHWVAWLKKHSKRREAPTDLGSERHPPLQAAPGAYVFE